LLKLTEKFMTTRRTFVIHTSAIGAGLALGLNHSAFAQAAMLLETDTQAVALGYKADTTKVDAKKYPKHTATQNCKNCSLYQGKAADKAGGCPLFAGKQVAAAGWCSAWVAKAA
jgi:High potential iron-sulfur protein